MTLPVKPINEIEEKAQVGADDRILILDADSEEARLASKDELKGDKGDQGDPGQAATVSVGSTCTLAPGSSACVSNSGSSSAAVFNFGIPKGEKGDQGNPGASATVSVGSTTTLDAGCCASVTNTGTTSAAVFNFGIPKGAKGDPGQNGQDGNDGASICAAAFNGNNIDFTDTCGCITTLCDAKTCLKGDQGTPGCNGNDGAPGQDGNGITCVTTSKSGKTTTVTMCYCTGDPTIFCVQDGADGQGSGDMSASTYDPTNKMADAFDYCNFYHTPTIPTDNCQLANGCGYTTCTGTVVAADLTPYAKAANLCAVSTSGKYCDLTGQPTKVSCFQNDSGYITGITCGNVTTALGYTPYNSTNPNGYTTCTGTVTSADLATYAKCSDVPTNNSQLANGCGYTTCTGTLSSGDLKTVNCCSLVGSGNIDIPSDAKVFAITGTTGDANLTAATNAYVYGYCCGKDAIIRYSCANYVYARGSGTAAYFTRVTGFGATSLGSWVDAATIKLTLSSGTVTAISHNLNTINISSNAPSSGTTNDLITLVK